MADVEAAAKHLAGKKLGIVGYCFGGTVAWWGATRSHSFAASSCWYGGGIAGTKDERPNCPVQMHFGEKDASIPMTDVDAVRAAQPKVETYVYMGARHGFGCDERGSFSKPDYELAQQRTLAVLHQTSRLIGGGARCSHCSVRGRGCVNRDGPPVFRLPIGRRRR